MNSKVKIVLIKIATALAVTVFLAWKIATELKRRRDARWFVTSDEVGTAATERVLRNLDVVANNTEDKIEGLKKAVEEQTKEEIVYAFKKAFGVSDSDSTTQYD